MKKQFESSPSQEMISLLRGKIERGELVLQPYFQRRVVWNKEHKEKFIQTILKGYPVPEIYISQEGINLQTLDSTEVVVDGQQRLTTILQYINGADAEFDGYKLIPKFKDLEDTPKKLFLSYKLIVRNLGEIPETDLKEIFQRINSTNYALNAMEINNALYSGQFIQSAQEFVNETKFSELPFLSDNDINRMEDNNYVLLLMATILEGGYFNGSKQVDSFIQSKDTNFPEKERMMSIMYSTYDLIKKLEFPIDSIWFRKSNYFSLFFELSKYISENNKIIEEVALIKERLMKFENLVVNAKHDEKSPYFNYYSAMYTGTNSRINRVTRGRFIKDALEAVSA